LGGPAYAFSDEGGLWQLVLIAGGAVFAAAFLGWALAWALKKPPRTRRAALVHLLVPGALAALATPFAFESLAHIINAAKSETPIALPGTLPDNAALAMAPLALLVGLPMVLIAGLAFTLVAFAKPARVEKRLPEPPVRRDEADARRAHDFQPFV
jgi:hypothetical protein